MKYKLLTIIALAALVAPHFSSAQNVVSTIVCRQVTHDIVQTSTDATTGGDVSNLQRFLYSVGKPINISGQVDAATKQAFSEWRASAGLPYGNASDNNGFYLVGPRTRALMAQAHCTASGPALPGGTTSSICPIPTVNITTASTDASTNGGVTKLQTFLKTKGGASNLAVTGTIDQATIQAFTTWRASVGLPYGNANDGNGFYMVGPQTRLKMSAACGGAGTGGTTGGTTGSTRNTQYDINHDGVIDMKDKKIVSDAFRKKLGDTGYNAAADFNGNQAIDFTDAQAVMTRFTNTKMLTDVNMDGVLDDKDAYSLIDSIDPQSRLPNYRSLPPPSNYSLLFDVEGDGYITITDIRSLYELRERNSRIHITPSDPYAVQL